MPSDLPMPGLKARPNRDGTTRRYWCAPPAAVKAGFTPKTVPLRYDLTDPAERALASAMCQRMQAEALEWTAGLRAEHLPFGGTVRDLVRAFQVDAASPYQGWKWNTRRTGDHVLKTVEEAFGARTLHALHLADFRRWYDLAAKPKAPGGPARIDRASKIMKAVRELVRYGAAAELPECARLRAVLAATEFKQAPRRQVRLELHHVTAFIAEAIGQGRVSLALATAIQFETLLRQGDVIGKWEPLPAGAPASGIVLNRRRWCNGLTWSDLAPDLTFTTDTNKTGQAVAHDLKACPLVLEVLAHVPADRRVGPVILEEATGRPYAEFAFGREWRVIARAAGIPDAVRNMDARAGGVSEADEAGAPLDSIRSTAAHSDAKTTLRYVRNDGLRKSRQVAELRTAHRAGRNKA